MLHGRLVGMLSASDLLDFMSALPAEPAEVRDRTERGILDDHTVEEAMSRAPMRTVAPDVPVSTVAEVLNRDRLHRLPVVDGDRLLGIVSTTDVVRALAHRRVERRVLVFPKRSRTD
jgi:acetoin utilization protein AcuB